MEKSPSAKKRSRRRGRSRTYLTLCFLLMSAGLFGTKLRLSEQREIQLQKLHPQAEFVSIERMPAEVLEAGSSVSCVRAVKLTQGEGFVRFKVKLLDSDGVPFDEKLQGLLDERAELEKALDPTVASYLAFQETIYEKSNSYDLMLLKGQFALKTLVRSDGEAISPESSYTSEELEELISGGALSQTFGSEDFIQLCDEEKPFERTLIYSKKLTAGDVCPLYSDIVIPSDCTEQFTTFDGFIRNEDGKYTEGTLYINDMQLLGEGYKLLVSAEIVASGDFENPLAAFNTAEKAAE